MTRDEFREVLFGLMVNHAVEDGQELSADIMELVTKYAEEQWVDGYETAVSET